MVKIVHHVIIRYQCSFLVDVLLYCAKKFCETYWETVASSAVVKINIFCLT